MAEANETPAPARPSLLRSHGGGPAPVSFLELFFDLVYVFAITQISHFVLAHESWLGLAQAGLIFAAVWWAWVYTTWATNWADPERVQVRIMLLAVMFASLVMAVAIPHAFDGNGLLFAVSYVANQVGRSVFLAYIMARDRHVSARSMVRITALFTITGCLWIAGAFAAEGAVRLAWWTAAMALEYAGPILGFRLPFLGRVSPSEWVISGAHMAERCALFIIIALGEEIVVTGATFAGQSATAPHTLAFAAAFTGSVLMWWIYFDVGAKRGAELIEHHEEPGRIARNAYTYLHIPIVAGIVGTAVADEMLLAHPEARTEPALILAMCGGGAVYLAGVGLFKRFANPFRNFPLSHRYGLVLLALLAVWSAYAEPPALVSGWLAVGILALVTAWEWGSFHGGWVERLENRLGPVGRYMRRVSDRAEDKRTRRFGSKPD
ncbi:MAG: low temperature requirement protein A [Novosphingobium sp.]|nr:low temperature requirement protein A [Novosphingobium sp.]